MKEYSVQGNRRNRVLESLIVVYFIIIVLINIFLSGYIDSLGTYAVVISVISLTPLPLAMFTMRWSMIMRLSKIPDLRGEYEGDLFSSYTDHKEAIPIKMTITQDAFRIDVRMKTKTSESHSCCVDIEMKGNCSVLTYAYKNTGRVSEGLSKHDGVCTLSFDGNDVEGEYYTGPERGTYGTMKLQKTSIKK